jgi:hypothetical protein
MPVAMAATMPRTFFFPLLGLLALTPACNVNLDPGRSVAMQDTLEITLFSKATDDLHTPYVQGATFSVNIATTDYSSSAIAGWTLKSSNPAVVQVDQEEENGALYQITATGIGSAVLSVVDGSGNVLDSHAVQVAQPDHVELCAHGLLLGGYSDSQSQVTNATVIQQGTATFLVRYYLGSQELFGNNAVTATGTGAVSANTVTSSFGDDRDWVEVDAAQAGTGQVSLAVAGIAPTVIPTTVVAPSAVQSIGLLPQTDTGAADGSQLYVFARAFDAQGTDIFGGSFSWSVNGAPVTASLGSGTPTDVLAYSYKGSASESVSDGLSTYTSSAITIHGTGATVDSTANVGCSVAGAPGTGTGAGGLLTLGLFAGGAIVSRKRRARAIR